MTDLVATFYATPEDFDTDTGGVILDEWSPERSFVADLRGAGAAKLIVQNDADTLPAAGGVVAWDAKGTRAFVSLVKKQEVVSIDLLEANEQTTSEMPGHLAIYKDGVIGPPGGTGREPVADTITYDFTHPGYTEDGSWVGAFDIMSVLDAQSSTYDTPGNDLWAIPWAEQLPTGLRIIGPTSGWTPSGFNDAPVGKWYGRDSFTAPVTGIYLFIAGGDNAWTFNMDGSPVASGGGDGNVTTSGFASASYVAISLTAGTHWPSWEVENYPPFGGPNPTGFAAGLYRPGYPPTLIWGTSGGARVNEYPADRPGMTVGTVIRLVTEEQQDAGRLAFVTLDFDDDLDSDGNAWEFFANITASCGRDSCLDLIEKLQASYADIWMDPTGWVLHAYNWGTFAPDSTVTITPGSNIRKLVHRTEDAPAGELLVLSALGWTKVGSGTHQAFLELGTEITETEVGRISTSVLDKLGITRQEIAVDFTPADDGEVPWLNADFVPGCLITAPLIDGSPSEERVLTLGVSLGSDDKLSVAVTVRDRIEELTERLIQELKT